MAAQTTASPRDCVLFLSHHVRPGAMGALAKMVAECGEDLDVVPVFDQTHDRFSLEEVSPNALTITAPQLEATLPYRNKNAQHPGTLWPRNIDLPLLWFFNANRSYRHYWVIEYDVRYSGRWPDFFKNFEDNRSDLLAMTVFDFAFRPSWGHWDSLHSDPPVAMDQRVRATLSFYRLSHRALLVLHQSYSQGAAGHYEVAIPTLLKQAGLTVEDIGGEGAYVTPGNRNRFYTNSPQTPGLAPGTFVLHPEGMVKEDLPNMLWNPFKD